MCGIAGLVDIKQQFGKQILHDIVVAMRDSLTHRGPDDAGIWINDEATCALGHRRLSIIDLSPDARQPMGNEDGAVQVTFNGEIYNFATLRAQLEAAGHRFRTQSDSEVLPHIFESMNPAGLQRIEGMFGFAVWHQQRQQLLLARDRFGKKPVYYAFFDGVLAFASELNALRHVPGFDASIDRDALAHYLMLQYVPSPYSIYRGARKLPPGSYLTLDLDSPGVVKVNSYYKFEPREPRRFFGRSLGTEIKRVKTTLITAVEKRLVSDVPLGAFLSGGIDSALVTAIVRRELNRPLQTFSIGFGGTTETEHEAARDIANHLGTEHFEQVLQPDALGMISEVAACLDEPNGDSSCVPTLLLSRFARERVTVAISGDGGDEMFGGYRRYVDTLRDVESVPPVGSVASQYLSSRWFTMVPEQLTTLMGGLPGAVAASLAEWRTRLDAPGKSPLHRMRSLDVDTYLNGAVLAKVDRMSMQVALEVRSPFLDVDVATLAQEMAARHCCTVADGTKIVLRELARDYLPLDITQRPKMGFGLPSNAWSRESVLQMAQELLGTEKTMLAQYLAPAALRSLLEAQQNPQLFSIYLLWPLLTCELWLRAHA